MLDVAERRGHCQVARRTMLEQQLDDARVSRATPVPDGEIDRLKIGPEASAEPTRGAEDGMHVGATIEEQRHELVRAAADRVMERRCADLVADVHKAWIRVEEPTDFLRVVACDRGMNGMTVGSRQDATATIPRLLQQPRDLRVTPLARHDDQTAIVQSVPFRIGAGVEQQLYGFRVSLANREVNGRRVPVLRAAELRVSFEQLAQRGDVAIIRGGQCAPDGAAFLGVELGRFDDRARRRADQRLDVAAQRVPGREAVLLRDGALRVPETAKLGPTP